MATTLKLMLDGKQVFPPSGGGGTVVTGTAKAVGSNSAAAKSWTPPAPTPTPQPTTVNVKPTMTQAQIQSAINGAPAGSTISFAGGNYYYNIKGRSNLNFYATNPIAIVGTLDFRGCTGWTVKCASMTKAFSFIGGLLA